MTLDLDLNAIPALSPPPGEVSNLTNAYSLKRFMYVTASICLSLSTIAVILRLFVKARVLHSFNWEDGFLVLSQLTFFAFTGLLITAVSLGQGKHQWNVSLAHLQQIAEYSNLVEILYGVIILGSKTAMVLQVRRIFVDTSKGVIHWLHESLLWLNVVVFIALMPTIIWTCVPREKLWTPWLPGYCISTWATLIISGAINLFTNFAVLTLPVAIIMRLKLAFKTRLVLSAVFGTAILGCIASTFRLVYTVLLTRTDDFTWAIMPVGLWASAEVTGMILAASIPMLPSFVKFVRAQATTEFSRQSGKSSKYGPFTRGLSRSNRSSLPGLGTAASRSLYYEMDDVSDVQVTVSSSQNRETEMSPAGAITKTINTQTTVTSRYIEPKDKYSPL